VGYDPGQTAALYSTQEFLGSKGPLARGTPDVDPLGVQNQNPGITTGQCPPQIVKAHLIVGRDQHRVPFIRAAKCVEARIHSVMHAANPPPGFESPPMIRPNQAG
jgi:hypothetical protein